VDPIIKGSKQSKLRVYFLYYLSQLKRGMQEMQEHLPARRSGQPCCSDSFLTNWSGKIWLLPASYSCTA
jgi:hypothetical protein